MRHRSTVLLDVLHRLLEKLPGVLPLEIFALGMWPLTGGHSMSPGAKYDDRQMVCCGLCVGVEIP